MQDKKKKQEEARKIARTETWTKPFDLCAIHENEWPHVMKTIFTSEKWTDLAQQRSKMFHIIANKADMMAFQKVKKIDHEMCNLLFSLVVTYAHGYSKSHNDQRRISLHDHFRDFCRTKEQQEAYKDYCNRFDAAVMLTDVLEVMVGDCHDLLHTLDPSIIVDEYKAVQGALSAMKDFTSIHHKTEHNELTTLFCDFCDEIQDYLLPKTLIFIKEYKARMAELQARGEVKEDSKLRSDRDFARDTLTKYFFYNPGECRRNLDKSKKKANKYLNILDDNKLKTALPYIIGVDRETTRIAMALDQLETLRTNLTKSEGEDKAFLRELAEITKEPELLAMTITEHRLKWQDKQQTETFPSKDAKDSSSSK